MTKTAKKAQTRKAQPAKKTSSAWVKDQPEVTPIPKRARGAAKLAEAQARRPVPAPPVRKAGASNYADPTRPANVKSVAAQVKANSNRVSGPPIPVVSSIATMTRTDRVKAAKVEHDALKVWADADKKGTKPETPVLAWLGENPSGSVQRKAQIRKATNGNGVRRSGVCTVVYFHDGVQQGEQYNTLSNLAYYTGGKGIRLTSGELRALLAKNGIESPETTAWEFTAPNNVVLSAKLA